MPSYLPNTLHFSDPDRANGLMFVRPETNF